MSSWPWVLAAAVPGTGTLPADGTGVARSVIALVVVFGLLGTLAWLARRGSLGRLTQRKPGGIAVETAVPLGERRSLAIVQVEGRRLLLGLTPVQVSVLAELAARPAAPAAAFAETLDARLTPPDRGTP